MQEKIEKYLLGLMSEKERGEFENELQNNPDMNEQFELERSIVTEIRSQAFVNGQIEQAKNELTMIPTIGTIVRPLTMAANIIPPIATSSSKNRRRIKMIVYPLSIAAMLLLVFFLNGLWQLPQYDKLYASAFEIYPNDYLVSDPNAFRGENPADSLDMKTSKSIKFSRHDQGDIQPDSLEIVAMKAYEKRNFIEAETKFNGFLAYKDNPELRFYLAVTQMQNGKTDLAIKTLRSLYLKTPDYRYYEEIRWYLALALLKLRHEVYAKKYLDELVKFDGVYLDKAKNLMDKL